MKNIVSIFLALIMLQSCKKAAFHDLGGNQTLKGIAIIYDTLSGTDTLTPLKNGKIFLRNAASQNGFLYSVSTDNQGYFSFTGIDPDSSYVIFSKTEKGSLGYFGERSYTAGSFTNMQSDTLPLFFDQEAQNGIHVIVRDLQGQPLPNLNAWVFNNPTLFASDTSAGRIFDIISNNNGVGNKFTIAPGRYYLRIKAQVGNLPLTGETAVDVAAKQLASVILTLTNNPLPRNGMEITVRDNYSTPINAVTVHAYRSRLLFENDTIQFNNSLFRIITGDNGKAAAYLIEPGEYFLRAIRVINSDTLIKTSSILVPEASINTAEIFMP
jgi:hypothetical protein